MIRYTRTESKPEVLSPEAHQAAESALKRLGKTSAEQLSDEERKELTETLDNQSE